jgi:hypothetical protein
MRAVLFVDQVDLQRSLAQELGRLGFDVILPITLNEARQALQGLAYHPNLVVMNLRNAEGGTLDLLNVISEGRIATPVVLVAEATEIAAVRHRISLDGIEVLPTETPEFQSLGTTPVQTGHARCLIGSVPREGQRPSPDGPRLTARAVPPIPRQGIRSRRWRSTSGHFYSPPANP